MEDTPTPVIRFRPASSGNFVLATASCDKDRNNQNDDARARHAT